ANARGRWLRYASAEEKRPEPGQSPRRRAAGGGGPQPTTSGFDGTMANNFASSTSLSSSEKEKIVQSMQEMFSHLDPEVIYIVLSECDFKVENAMDSLLELSVAAEVAAPMPSHVSGFELTAAALLRPLRFSEPKPDSSKPPQLPSPPSTNLLTEELDLLVDQELETLTAQQCAKEDHHSSPYLSVGMSLSSFPPPPFPQQVLPELLQSSMQPGSRGSSGGGPVEHISGASSPLDQLSIWEDEMVEKQQSRVDFTHLMTENPADKTKSPLDLAASGRPSAFQVYKKQDPLHTLPDSARVMPSKAIVGGARSKVNIVFSPCPWKPGASLHYPCGFQLAKDAQACLSLAESGHGRPGTAQTFCYYPKVLGPVCWATSPPPVQQATLGREGPCVVTRASRIWEVYLGKHNRGGVILSTDNYFTRHGEYQFDPTALGEAHEWNHKQAKEAFERGANPIIIDNTNMQGWEMKPYVAQALKNVYKVLFREPDTWWKSKPRELERRTKHDVPLEKIRRMLNSYERYVTVQSIMGSQMPEVKQRLAMENRSPQPVSSETPRPDLVGQPGLTEGFKPRPQLFSSLPDVSSIGRSGEVGMLEDCPNESTESLNLQHTESFTEHPEINDEEENMDLGELDSELDAQIYSNLPIGDQRIPDCIVESVMSEGHRGDELPVAFSESIAQRVRRERPSRRSDFDRSEPADVVKDTNQSDSEAKEKEKSKEAEGVEIVRDGREKGRPYMLDFVGDWPSEGSLEQRQLRRSERHEEANGKKEEVSQEAQKKKTKVQSGSNVTEFQKLLDLIQTGVADIQTDSSRSSSLSPTPREELEKEEEAAGIFGDSHESRSNREESQQNMTQDNCSRAELPDCVLDWKAADSAKVKDSRIDHWEGQKTENEASRTTGGNVLEMGSETGSVDVISTNPTNPLSDPIASLLEPSNTVEASVCHDGQASHNIECEVGTEPETSVEADQSHASDACQSPVCEGSVETESSSFSGGSQERRLRPGRRSGKQCKLALTFTQNCPASSMNNLESPNTSTQSINSTLDSIKTDIEPDNCDISLSIKPNSDLSIESNSEAQLQPPSPLPLPLVDGGHHTQTEPQDFALLWRLNHKNSSDDAVVTGDIQSCLETPFASYQSVPPPSLQLWQFTTPAKERCPTMWRMRKAHRWRRKISGQLKTGLRACASSAAISNW
ncbi:hypothetical protein F7725_005465, partial [Dissostichus mawsoni]